MSPTIKRLICSFLALGCIASTLLYTVAHHSSSAHAATNAAASQIPLSVYIGSDTTEYAFNASDGSLRWSYTTTGVVDTTAVVANGVVYFGSDDAAQATSAGILYALNTSDGSLLWQFTFPELTLLSSPAIANGIVYIAAGGVIYAFNASNGSMLWKFLTDSSLSDFFLAPSVANGFLYMGTDKGNMYALNASTGTLIWQYTLYSIYNNIPGFINSSALVVNGNVYFGGEADTIPGQSDSYYLYALNATTGSLLWQTQLINHVQPRISYANGLLYFSASDEVYALNASDGSVLWSHQIGAYSSPAVGTYKTLLGTSHYLTALSTQTGALGKRYLVGIISTPLVIYKHVLYFTTYDTAKLYAFDFQTWTPIWVDNIARETEAAPTLA